MKVKVKYRTIDDAPAENKRSLFTRDWLYRAGFDTEFASIGDEFIVYGIYLSEGNLWYNLAKPPRGSAVIMVLAALFEISDPTISQHWECRVDGSGDFAIWPRSWFEIPFYHDRLSDGDPEVVEDWQKVKRLFDDENSRKTAAC